MCLTFEVIKKHCVLVLHIECPTDTLRRLTMFFADRHIELENVQMHRLIPFQSTGGAAMLILHCMIEKDRIGRTMHLLEEMPGVMRLEKMEG